MRRAGGGALTYKHGLNKKNISHAGVKQYSSPPIAGKGQFVIDKQGPPYQNANLSLNIPNASFQNLNTHSN